MNDWIVVDVAKPIPTLRTLHARNQRIRLQKAVDIRRIRMLLIERAAAMDVKVR